MNKAQLIKAVANKLRETDANVERIVNALFDTMAVRLRSGYTLTIYGFGRFTRKLIPSRKAWSGTELKKKYRIYFRCGSGLKKIGVRDSSPPD